MPAGAAVYEPWVSDHVCIFAIPGYSSARNWVREFGRDLGDESTAARPASPPAVPPPPRRTEAPRTSGPEPTSALTELRNACATYDYLRSKGDPAHSGRPCGWRGAAERSSRPSKEKRPPAPQWRPRSPRARHHPSAFRAARPGPPELPEERSRTAGTARPARVGARVPPRFRREHQAVARWLAEPAKHEGKAAESSAPSRPSPILTAKRSSRGP